MYMFRNRNIIAPGMRFMGIPSIIILLAGIGGMGQWLFFNLFQIPEFIEEVKVFVSAIDFSHFSFDMVNFKILDEMVLLLYSIVCLITGILGRKFRNRWEHATVCSVFAVISFILAIALHVVRIKCDDSVVGVLLPLVVVPASIFYFIGARINWNLPMIKLYDYSENPYDV